MIKKIRPGIVLSLSAVSLAGLLAGPRAQAAPPLRAPEDTLLGVKLMSRFSDVLRKYGQPNEIQVGSPTLPTQSPAGATGGGTGSAAAPSTGGAPGMSGGYGGYGAGRPTSGPPPGAGGGYGAGYAAQYGAGGGGARGGGAGLPGFGNAGGAQSGGPPPGASGGYGAGYAAQYGAGGGKNGPASAGGGAQAGNAANGENTTSADTTWWYHDFKMGVHKAFLFNKDGRVIQIQEYGYKGGSATRQGIALGSGLGTLIQRYGWSNDGTNDGTNLIMRYGGDRKVAFQLVENRVVGITVAVTK